MCPDQFESFLFVSQRSLLAPSQQTTLRDKRHYLQCPCRVDRGIVGSAVQEIIAIPDEGAFRRMKNS